MWQRKTSPPSAAVEHAGSAAGGGRPISNQGRNEKDEESEDGKEANLKDKKNATSDLPPSSAAGNEATTAGKQVQYVGEKEERGKARRFRFDLVLPILRRKECKKWNGWGGWWEKMSMCEFGRKQDWCGGQEVNKEGGGVTCLAWCFMYVLCVYN